MFGILKKKETNKKKVIPCASWFGEGALLFLCCHCDPCGLKAADCRSALQIVIVG